ncbi:C4-dicarboxylate TRAP transporter substrate-binding protein [Pararhodobacter zhoushanensis]|uniref:C4-dicarboxylate TRAP transporter substrate-binding protein n=1 Tax=Pararhodobacter zhoushanensis TaxID=2479545 RepID=UPI000F8D14C1|nr:C4-dicarboxylate TRAP transporter substrate-binding protein [Pararhodobacter zhoushanensis]
MTLTIRRLLTGTALATALSAGLALPAMADETIDITIVNGHPPIFLWVKHLTESFIPAVDAALEGSGYSINWTEAYGGTLAGVGGELEAIENGLAEIGSVPTVFMPNQLPLQNVTYNTPFGPSSAQMVMSAMEVLYDTIPAMGESWHTYDTEYLGGGFALDNYILMTNFPVTSIDDLAGHRIAAPGPAVNWLEGTGAVGVAGNLTTYYNDLQTGVFDGVIVFATAAAPARLQEVAPYVTVTDFGAQSAGGIVANQTWFADQPEVVQNALRAGAAAYQAGYLEEQSARVTAAMAAIAPDAEHLHTLAPEERARWAAALPDVAGTWAAATDAAGLPATEVLNAYVATLQAAGADLGRDWSMR